MSCRCIRAPFASSVTFSQYLEVVSRYFRRVSMKVVHGSLRAEAAAGQNEGHSWSQAFRDFFHLVRGEFEISSSKAGSSSLPPYCCVETDDCELTLDTAISGSPEASKDVARCVSRQLTDLVARPRQLQGSERSLGTLARRPRARAFRGTAARGGGTRRHRRAHRHRFDARHGYRSGANARARRHRALWREEARPQPDRGVQERGAAGHRCDRRRELNAAPHRRSASTLCPRHMRNIPAFPARERP